MADTTNTAEIRVVADASGVEAGLQQATNAAQRAERAIAGIGSGSARSQQNLIQAIQRTTAEMEAGSRTGARYFEVLAQQRGIDPGVLQPYLQQLRAMEQAQQSAGQSAGQTANALRQVPAQLTDIVTSLQGGMEPLTVLIQQGGQLRDSFGGIGPAARALGSQLMALVNPYTLVAAATATVAALYLDSVQSADAYTRAIGETGNAAGVTTDQLSEMARVLGKGDATEALTGLTKASQVSAENIQRFAEVAIESQRVLGKAVAETVEEFDSLGGAPSEALSKLNDKYHFLTAQVYAQVKALEDQGKAAEAASMAQLAFAEGMEKQRYKVLDSLSDWERGWLRIKKAASEAIDATLGIAKASTDAQQITSLLKDRERIEENIALARGRRDEGTEKRQKVLLDQNKAQINAIRARTDAEKAAAKAEADAAALNEARIKWDDQADAFLSKKVKREQEITKARNEGAAAGASAAEIEERIGLIRKKYEVKGSGDGAKRVAAERKEEARLLAELSGVTGSYMEDLSRLNGQYAKGSLSQERYVELVTELISKQPGAKQMIAETAKEMADYAKVTEAANQTFEKEIEAITKQIQATRDENEQIGLSKAAIAELDAARLESMAIRKEENAIIAEGLDLTGEKAERLRQEAAKLRELAQEKRAGAAKQASFDSAKQAADDWKKTSDSIEQSLTDALLRGFESGKSFGKNLVDTLKNMFGTLVLRPLIQATLAPVTGGLTSMLSGGAAPAGGGSMTATAQNAAKLYDAFKSGGTLQTSVTNGVQAAFDKIGLSQAGGAPGTAAQSIGSMAGQYVPVIATAVAAYYAGSAVAGGYKVGGTGLANVINSFGILGGLVNRAFGRKDKEYADTSSLVGSIGMGGFAGTVNTAWKQEGGWFRSDKSGADKAPVNADVSKQLGAGYEALKMASADFAKTLGINADFIAARAQSVNIALGKDDAANQKAIAEFFVGVGGTIAGELLPSLASFQKEGEGASAALQRLATGYALIDTALTSIGMSFGAVGTSSLEARERLLEAAGGLDAFAANTAGFQQNFLSEMERNAPVLKSVTEQLAAMGLSAVDTREEFKNVILGLDLTTEAGASQYGALIKLQGAFAQVYPAIDKAAIAAAELADAQARANEVLAERRSLQDQLDELTMSSVQLLAKQRNALDESNRPLFDQIEALKASKIALEAQAEAQRTATQAAEEARLSAIQAAKDRTANLLSGVDSAFSALQTVVGREKALLQEVTGKHQALASALRGTLDSMSVSGQDRESRNGAQAQIQAALAIAKASGVLPDADSLKGALSVLGKDSASLFSTQQEYLRDFYATQGDIAALAGLTDDALSVEEKSLKALDDILKNAELQVNALKGIDLSVFSLAEAIRGFEGSLGAAKADPVASAGGNIAQLYKDLLGRPADSAGLDYWKEQAAGGLSLADIRKFIMASAEYKGLPGFAVGTNFVPGDMTARIHQGERIIPAADNRELMRRLSSPSDGNAALVGEVRRLAGIVEQQQQALDRIATSTGQLADQFENATDGGNAARVEVINVVQTQGA